MNYILAIGLLLMTMQAYSSDANLPVVALKTNMGTITLELYPDKAPKTVANFLRYVKEDFYANTLFHRVIKDFMIQGGGFTPNYQQKPTHEPIENEADNGLEHVPGTLAMARTQDPHSATAQFFINVNNNNFLNHSSKTVQGWGYTVFGKVTEGMDIVNKISQIKTGQGGPFPTDVPQQPIVIENIQQLEGSTENK